MASTQEIKRTRLPNGLNLEWVRFPNQLDLLLIENREDPSFVYQTWFDVGSLTEKLDPKLKRTGLAHLFEHMMFRGTEKYPDGEFDRLLSRYGGYNNATTWNDRTNYYEVMAQGNLERVIQLESDRFQNLIVDEKLLETERGAVLGEYRMGRDNASTVAYDHLYATALDRHPYRYTVIGTEEEIKSFTVEEANDFYHRYYSPDCATIMIAGDFDSEQAKLLVNQYYGQIQSVGKFERPKPELEVKQEKQKWFEFKHPQISETRLIFAYHTPEFAHPDMAALLVFDSILTQGRGAVLFQRWVSDHPWVSDVQSSVDQFKYPALFGVDCDLQKDVDPKQILKDFDQLLKTKVTEEEVERALNQLLLDLYENWEDMAETCNFIGESLVSAGDPLYGFELVEKIKKIKADDIEQVKKRYFNSENRTVIIGRAQS